MDARHIFTVIFLGKSEDGKVSHGRNFPTIHFYFFSHELAREKSGRQTTSPPPAKRCFIIDEWKIVFHLNIFQLPEDNEVTVAVRIFRSQQ